MHHGLGVSRSTTALVAIATAVLALTGGVAVGTHRGVDEARRTTVFTGAVSSLYDGQRAGCVRADAGQGMDTASDTHCGPLYAAAGVALEVGSRVHVRQFSLRDADGSEVSGFLVGAG